jgi:multiple sugar transport system substrate-binding protein
LGEEPFLGPNEFVLQATGVQALGMLRELLKMCGEACENRNPIAVWELLAANDSVAYCPFAYGYSNYSRSRYAANPIVFGELIHLNDGTTLRSTLGGAGLAISAHCDHKNAAAQYAEFVAGEECECGKYFDSGGQPENRAGWLDAEVNRRSRNFFLNTVPVLDRAYLRPRSNGYLQFQDKAGAAVYRCVWEGADTAETIRELNWLWASEQ